MASSLKLSNNGLGRIVSSIAAGTTTFGLVPGDGAKFPAISGAEWFPITVIRTDGTFEIMRVTTRSVDTLTVVRAQEGTTALAFSANDRVELRATVAALEALRDTAFTDKGTASAGGTITFSLKEGKVQRLQVGSALTLALADWPANTNLNELMIELVNGGGFTLTWPTINWIKQDGSVTNNINTYLTANSGRTALQITGTDFFLLWTRDGGTTVWGKLV